MGSLTKRDLLSVVIGGFGLYLIYRAVSSIVTLILGVYYLWVYASYSAERLPSLGAVHDKGMVYLLTGIVELVVYLLGAWFFLRWGHLLLRIVPADDRSVPNP